jgi:2,3-diketo-5-methylthio-1-phosphopentane phosphatase
MESFALPEWLQVEEEWKAGRIGSQECMRRQVELLRCNDDQLTRCLSQIEIDSEFSCFVSFCNSNKLNLFIVSDGIDYAIQTILERYQLAHLPIYANRLKHSRSDRQDIQGWNLLSPYADTTCERGNGVCKCSLMRNLSKKGEIKILIGDGRSDFCAAGKADIILAKDSLLSHCQKLEIPHIGFQRFGQVIEILRILLTAGKASEEVLSYPLRPFIDGVEIL